MYESLGTRIGILWFVSRFRTKSHALIGFFKDVAKSKVYDAVFKGV